MSDLYEVSIRNANPSKRTMCLFLEYPGIQVSNLKTYAWLYETTTLGGVVTFKWEQNCQVGYVKTKTDTANNRRTEIVSRKLVPMELGNLNSVKIFKDTEDDYGVTEPVKEQRLNHNEVYIECDSTVSASDQCHIAVGMGDRVAFSYPTEPNMNHTLAINPRIYLMATSRVVTGDISDTMRSNAVLLDFKDGNEERFEYTKDNRFVRDAMKQ